MSQNEKLLGEFAQLALCAIRQSHLTFTISHVTDQEHVTNTLKSFFPTSKGSQP